MPLWSRLAGELELLHAGLAHTHVHPEHVGPLAPPQTKRVFVARRLHCVMYPPCRHTRGICPVGKSQAVVHCNADSQGRIQEIRRGMNATFWLVSGGESVCSLPHSKHCGDLIVDTIPPAPFKLTRTRIIYLRPLRSHVPQPRHKHVSDRSIDPVTAAYPRR